MLYVRWKQNEPRKGRVFGALAPGHPLIDMPCVVCTALLGTGPVQLVAVGPDDEEAQEKHDAGRWYTAAATVAHETCVAGMTEPNLDAFVRSLVVKAV